MTGIILSVVLAFQLASPLDSYEAAKAKDLEYRQNILRTAHVEFVLKFNRYLEKYHRGELAVKELKEATEAWKKLEKTEGFYNGKSNPKHTPE